MAEVKVSALTALTGANVANGDELYIVDTGSPNVSKKITADELAQMPQLSSRYMPKASDTMWIGAASWHLETGVTMADYAGRTPFVAYDASTTECATITAYLPSWWTTFDVDLYWTNSGGGSGDVRWLMTYGQMGDGDSEDSTTFSLGSAQNVTAPSQRVIKVTRVKSGQSITAGKPFGFALFREADNVGDTLANDAGMLGLLLTRAS